MADVTVTVTKTFEYRGQPARKGSAVNMDPVDAAIESRRGNVTLVAGAVVPPDPEPEPAQRRRRTYRRRDMVAETPNEG